MISILLAALVACSKTETPAQAAPPVESKPVVVEQTTPVETTETPKAEAVSETKETTPAPATTTGN